MVFKGGEFSRDAMTCPYPYQTLLNVLAIILIKQLNVCCQPLCPHQCQNQTYTPDYSRGTDDEPQKIYIVLKSWFYIDFISWNSFRRVRSLTVNSEVHSCVSGPEDQRILVRSAEERRASLTLESESQSCC